MNPQNLRTRKSTLSMLLIAAMLFVSGCSTDSGAKKSVAANSAPEGEYLTAADARKDPDRIVCRRHKPTGSRISEKICMTSRQWQQMNEDTQRVLDRAQGQTGWSGVD